MKAEVWSEVVKIPTYPVGETEKLPIFLENRVYQGSCGKVYPYPVIEKITDQKVSREYRAVFLENEYLKIMILPQLGGRVQRAYDKTNGYDFVYYNQVIKPALVGLMGPWISGGIEFNWPQHHRPTTFMPVESDMKEYEDGSVAVLVSDVDRMYGTRVITEFRLYPGKAYLEIKSRLYNRTNMPQTFLWWANPAVAVNDDTASIFPPDVTAVMDHGKRDVSSFPIAKGVYYKHDYSAGVDISRYKNIPVPTSYMAAGSKYDFLGNYDYGKSAGLLHIADHHVSPGKKQWTWGNGDFGKAWDRNLTDEDGPYIELMTGMYTDNQPDFSWLEPFEEKEFTQYFMPYKNIGRIMNATKEAAVNVEVKEKSFKLMVYTSSVRDNVIVKFRYNNEVIGEDTVSISPINTYEKEFSVGENTYDGVWSVCVLDESGVLVEATKETINNTELPEPAREIDLPDKLESNEELWLAGMHLEQYRHATYRPEDYYLEGLRRDPGDYRINAAYGMLLLRRGQFETSVEYFKKANERICEHNPNPCDGKAYLGLGVALYYCKRYDEAYDAFYKAIWNKEQQEEGFYYLSLLSLYKKKPAEALEFINRCIAKNSHNMRALNIRAIVLQQLGRNMDYELQIKENLNLNPFDMISLHQASKHLSQQMTKERFICLAGTRETNYLLAASDYTELGAYDEAFEILEMVTGPSALCLLYKAYIQTLSGNEEKAKEYMGVAEHKEPDDVFADRNEDIVVLKALLENYPRLSIAAYLLGNIYFDRKRYSEAIRLFEGAVTINKNLYGAYRNLALLYYNKQQETSKALGAMEMAYKMAPDNTRIFLERDALYKKMMRSPEKRLEEYERFGKGIFERDELKTEYVTLLNLNRRYLDALHIMENMRFHPWEGGEGKITVQYRITLKHLALLAYEDGNKEQALSYIERAMSYPENLGEGKIESQKDNDLYYIGGCILETLGMKEKAKEWFVNATMGDNEVAGIMYYNDQPADMILYRSMAYKRLGDTTMAKECLRLLEQFGSEHENDVCRIGYFAVSLPDFKIFESDLSVLNKAHCNFVVGLAYVGEGKYDKAVLKFRDALSLERYHLSSNYFLHFLEDKIEIRNQLFNAR